MNAASSHTPASIRQQMMGHTEHDTRYAGHGARDTETLGHWDMGEAQGNNQKSGTSVKIVP
jgi:hypothetical protein